MFLADSTGALRRVRTAIAAAVVFTLGVTIAMPAWAQTPSAPSAAEVRPRLHGYLLDDREFTVIDAPDAILGTGALGINNRGEIVGTYVDAGGPTAGGFTPRISAGRRRLHHHRFPGAVGNRARRHG
jgi:hypothetical protein